MAICSETRTMAVQSIAAKRVTRCKGLLSAKFRSLLGRRASEGRRWLNPEAWDRSGMRGRYAGSAKHARRRPKWIARLQACWEREPPWPQRPLWPAAQVPAVPIAASYAELLTPIPNAVERLRAADAAEAEAPKLIDAQYVAHYHHHHHHHHSRRWYMRNGYMWSGGAWILRPVTHHHHHHHHHHQN